MDGGNTCYASPPNEILGYSLEFILSAFLQGGLFIIISHFFHFFLRRFAQPRITSQLLAGIVLGPTIWPPQGAFSKFFFPKDISMYLSLVGDVAGKLFIFLVGLELDIPHMLRTKRTAGSIALGGIGSCLILSASVSYFLYNATGANCSLLLFALLVSALLSSTSSPVLIEMCARLKLATSDIGRLAVSTALLNDLASLILLTMFTSKSESRSEFARYFGEVVPLFIIMTILIVIFRACIQAMNRLHPQRKRLRRMEMLWIMTFVVGVICIVKKSHYSPMIGCFFVGLFFPKDGKICKLLAQQLMVVVHELVFPIYFGYTGVTTDVKVIGKNWNMVCLVIAIAGLSTLGKMAGTLAVTTYFKMTLRDGIVLGLLLNVKAHLNIMFMGIFTRRQIWNNDDQMMLLIPTMLCTIVSGPLVGRILRRERGDVSLNKAGLEFALPDSEIHILSCVYTPRHIPAMLNLIEASRWAEGALNASVMHLMQLTGRTATTLLFHQRTEDEDDEDDEDRRHISDAVDSFCIKTGMCVLLHRTCIAFEGMHTDVCRYAEKAFPSIVILPFHKHLRVDGRMEVTNDGYKITNNKILQYAHCTVVILLDRGFGGLVHTLDAEPFGISVLVVFLGGADDREAAAYAARLAYHPRMTVALMRFLPAAWEEFKVEVEPEPEPECSERDEVTMSISNQAVEEDADGDFVTNFRERYVESGLVVYTERRVKSGIEIATTLGSMKGDYTLFVVGRGRHSGASTMTNGLSDFEDYSDLGPIGGLLASPDFNSDGSVLVVQQYAGSKQNQKERE